MRTKPITEFKGEFFFLSNFYTAPFVWRTIKFQSAEQAFAYAKTLYMDDAHDRMRARQAIQFNAQSPGDAKKMGRAVEINVTEWDWNKVQHMRAIIHAKFSSGGVDLRSSLLDTGGAMLVEGNTWGDTFWGVSGGRGNNILGAILMEERGFWRNQ